MSRRLGLVYCSAGGRQLSTCRYNIAGYFSCPLPWNAHAHNLLRAPLLNWLSSSCVRLLWSFHFLTFEKLRNEDFHVDLSIETSVKVISDRKAKMIETWIEGKKTPQRPNVCKADHKFEHLSSADAVLPPPAKMELFVPANPAFFGPFQNWKRRKNHKALAFTFKKVF